MRNNRLYFLAIVVFALSVFVLATSALAATDPPAIGDWFISENAPKTGETIHVEGSIIVELGGTLNLVDCVVYINQSLSVHEGGSLIVEDSTIKFNCTSGFINTFEVHPKSTVTIKDLDSDYSTTNDRSIITSNSSEKFNWFVSENATFSLTDSLVTLCGRYINNQILDEGLVMKTGGAIITGTTFNDCYYGLILEGVANIRLENCTFENNQIGAIVKGTHSTEITACNFINNTDIGLQVQALHHNLRVMECHIAGNGRINLNMFGITGSTNHLTRNTIGPGGMQGLAIDSVDDVTVEDTFITGCVKGLDVTASNVGFINNRITNCSQGFVAHDGGSVSLENLNLNNTTLSVESDVDINVTNTNVVKWDTVQGSIACPVIVQQGATLEIESSSMDYLKRGTILMGLNVEFGGTLTLRNSTIESTMGGWIFHMLQGSRVDLLNVTLRNVGTDTEETIDRGVYFGGSGTARNVAISQSFYGMVLGKSTMILADFTIDDCGIGILADGDLGRGGAEVDGLDIRNCGVAVKVVAQGSFTIKNGFVRPVGEGFNLSASKFTVRDTRIDPPGVDYPTATLVDTSVLDLVNCDFTEAFELGAGNNVVNVKWYLNLTLEYDSDGTPVSDAKVTAKQSNGANEITDLDAGPAGYLALELREKSINPDVIVTTPHTVYVSKGTVEDYFEINIDHSQDYTFILDNHSPVLTIDNPENGSVHNTSNITFSGTAYDAKVTAHEGLALLRYRVDSGPWIPIPLPSAQDWSFTITIGEGVHVVDVEVIDIIGNARIEMLTIEVDSEPPMLVITLPMPPVLTNEPILELSGITDPGNEVKIDNVSIEVSGSGYFNHTLELTEGPNTIIIEAIDGRGNTNTKNLIAILDTIAPEVTLIPPIELRTREASVTVEGVKEPGASISVNGDLPQFITVPTFQTTVDLVEGQNSIVIMTADEVGNTWTKTIIVIRDSTPPELFVKPLESDHVSTASFTVQGTVDDLNATVKVNGVAVTLNGKTFMYSFTLVEGTNTFDIEAEDDLGNAAPVQTVTVVLDTQPPLLTLVTNKVIKTKMDRHNLTGSTEPGITVVVSVVKGGYAETYETVSGEDGTFSVEVLLPQLGNHTVTVTVMDKAGNRSTDTLNFERERLEPNGNGGNGDGSSWILDNWEWLVLAASIVASIGVLVVTAMPRKRRRVSQRPVPPRPQPPAPVADEDGMEQEDDEYEDEGHEGEDEGESEDEAPVEEGDELADEGSWEEGPEDEDVEGRRD